MRLPKTERNKLSNFFADLFERLYKRTIRLFGIEVPSERIVQLAARALCDQLAPMLLVFFLSLLFGIGSENIFVKALLLAGVADAVTIMDAALESGRAARMIRFHQHQSLPLSSYMLAITIFEMVFYFIISVLVLLFSLFVDESIINRPIVIFLLVVTFLIVMATCYCSVLVNELCSSKLRVD